MTLDHLFVCVDDLPAAEHCLVDFGLQFGRHTVHRGQGTANACAFFDNTYLEILCPHDDRELHSEPVRPLALWERLHWRETGACPYGIALRPEPGEPALPTWSYAAAYLPPGETIPIVTPRNAARGPLVFLLPETWSMHRWPSSAHRGACRRVTRITLSGPETSPVSSRLRSLRDIPLDLKPAAEHHLELEWDNGAAREGHDFRPALPLAIRC